MHFTIESIRNLLNIRNIIIDNIFFFFHYKVTMVLLVIFSLLLSKKHYFGDPIDCLVERCSIVQVVARVPFDLNGVKTAVVRDVLDLIKIDAFLLPGDLTRND